MMTLVLIPGLVLFGALFNGWIAVRHAHREDTPSGWVTGIGCLAPILAFACSWMAFCDVRAYGMQGGVLTTWVYRWFATGHLQIDVSLRVDALSAVMLLVVTGVGSLIHVYSMGYMHGDKGYARFYAYLNLFMFFMTTLVMADSLVLLFLGWEGVGLASYLLIGFWWEDPYKADCGKKAFIVNRIGDLGFILGLLTLFSVFGTLDVHGVAADSAGLVERVRGVSGHLDARIPGGVFAGWTYQGVITLSCLLMFVGACGKSAQLPLYVWLPDAMAGPTPVSALIHAATMVTAGVYMVARMNFLYSLSPVAQGVVACVGTATALLAASMGLVQTDIKKVLAYSTVSQLGYMFLGVGLGAYSAGIFHLFTHAFFKACLFLGAGSVIHGMHHEQDIRKMGGLREFMPHTYRTFFYASLAIAGIFPFAGFFSKDEILLMAFTSESFPVLGKLLWGVGMVAAGMTAFYMFRLVFLTFHGECRADKHVQHHIHESPFSMVSVLWVLAFGSGLVGFLNFPRLNPWFSHFLDGLFAADQGVVSPAHHPALSLELSLAVFSMAWALAWILVARRFYVESPAVPGEVAQSYPGAYHLLSERFFVDTIYEGGVVQPLWAAARGFFYRTVDVRIIDGLVNGVGLVASLAGEVVRIFQTGVARTYVLFVLFGAILVLWSLIF
ncbi:MAG: NADH-quinone oxidoreductase subunit L [Planctomycetes bacterium]|nr:NADH-quinone oxidoreductase subunit L [Planctomycetota bacterium]